MKKGWTRRAGIRVATRLTRFARRGDSAHGRDFRTHGKRERIVAFYWLIDGSLEDEESVAEIQALSKLADVVVVTNSLDFEQAMELGVFVEALPTLKNTEILPSIDWKLYTKRRVWRLREYWRPDIETGAGKSFSEYLNALGQKTETVSVRELEELPLSYFPDG